MLQKLSEKIRECLRHADECKRKSLTPSEIQAYLEMQQRWLTLALQLADDSFPNGSQFWILGPN